MVVAQNPIKTELHLTQMRVRLTSTRQESERR